MWWKINAWDAECSKFGSNSGATENLSGTVVFLSVDPECVTSLFSFRNCKKLYFSIMQAKV
jgi:hypothetical protein